MPTPDDLRRVQETAPIVFEADSIPYTPGYRNALHTWLTDHGINPNLTIRFEIHPPWAGSTMTNGYPATITAVMVVHDEATGGCVIDPASGLIATETVAGVPVVRDFPRQEEFGFGTSQEAAAAPDDWRARAVYMRQWEARQPDGTVLVAWISTGDEQLQMPWHMRDDLKGVEVAVFFRDRLEPGGEWGEWCEAADGHTPGDQP